MVFKAVAVDVDGTITYSDTRELFTSAVAVSDSAAGRADSASDGAVCAGTARGNLQPRPRHFTKNN